MEPLLLEELSGDNVPKSFEKLINTVKTGDVLNKNDYMVLMSHILMLESGFVGYECKEYHGDSKCSFNYKRLMEIVDKLPPNWKRNNVLYSISYVYPPMPQNVCKLTCIVNGEDLVINASAQDIEDGNYSILIDTSRYVISSTSNLANMFQDTRHLSQIFKTIISNPLRNVVLKFNNYPQYSLEDMPVEILEHIKKFLDLKSETRFRGTCKYMRTLVGPSYLMKPGCQYERYGCHCNRFWPHLNLREFYYRSLNIHRFIS